MNDIDSNDYYMYIYNNIDNLTSNEKKKIQKFFLSKENDSNKIEFIKAILLFITNYFQYYMTFTELLYDDKNTLYILLSSNILYNSGHIFSKLDIKLPNILHQLQCDFFYIIIEYENKYNSIFYNIIKM